MIEKDLSIFFNKFSIDFTIDGDAQRGIFNENNSPAFSGIQQAEGDRIVLLVKTVIANNYDHGVDVEIGDRNFTLKGKEKYQDGVLTELILNEVD